jgi:hypothetical protein
MKRLMRAIGGMPDIDTGRWQVMSGPTATVAVALLLGCLLAGCAHDGTNGLPEYDPAAGGPATPTSVVGTSRSVWVAPRVKTPKEVRYRPADARGMGAWVQRGRIRAGTAPRRAVVDAVVKYLTVRVQLSNTWQVDERALAARQRERNRRTVGRFVLNVSRVSIDGRRATVTGCDFDATSEVDEVGNTIVPPPGGIRVTLELRRTGDTWRVTDWPRGPVPYCDWRR